MNTTLYLKFNRLTYFMQRNSYSITLLLYIILLLLFKNSNAVCENILFKPASHQDYQIAFEKIVLKSATLEEYLINMKLAISKIPVEDIVYRDIFTKATYLYNLPIVFRDQILEAHMSPDYDPYLVRNLEYLLQDVNKAIIAQQYLYVKYAAAFLLFLTLAATVYD